MLEMLKQLEAEEESATGDVEADTEDFEADAAADLQARFADVDLGMPAVDGGLGEEGRPLTGRERCEGRN